MICQIKKHNNLPIKGICISPSCKQCSYGCDMCVQKYHQDHQILNLDAIQKHIKTLTFPKILPDLVNQCQENATQLQITLKQIDDFHNGFTNQNTAMDLEITAEQLKYLNSEDNKIYTEFLSNAILQISVITHQIKDKINEYLQILNDKKQIGESDIEQLKHVSILQQKEASTPLNRSCQKCQQQSRDPLYRTQCYHQFCFKCAEASLQQQPDSRCPLCNSFLDKVLLQKYYRQHYQRENYFSNIYEQNSEMNSSVYLEQIDLKNTNIKNMNSFIELFENLSTNQIRFKDPDFPHNDTSIGMPSYCKWMNAAELYFNDFLIFTKDQEAQRYGLGKLICPNDIKQGALGNCYFLASISALGNKRPDILFDRFITKSVNPFGIYCMSLCINGEWTAIWVDDYFPVIDQRLVFTTGRNQAIWVMLLEKAWAKVYKSYKNTEAGYVSEALRILSGAPSEDLFVGNPKFIQKLQQYLEENAILTASSGYDEQVRLQGLAPNHAYSILKIVVIKLGNQFVQLIELRNPWGKQEWKGDWSQNSPLWTPELRQNLKLGSLDTGIFFMELGQFMQYFHNVQICHVKDNYQYSSLRSQCAPKKGGYFSVKVSTPGKYYFSVIQNSSRMPGNSDYCYTKILVCKKLADSFYYINGKSGMLSDTNTLCDITEGEYIIYAKIEQYKNQNIKFTISSYGPEQLQITKIEKQQDMLRSVFLKKGMSDGKLLVQQLLPLVDSYFSIDKKGWGYYIIDNSSNKNFNFEIKFIMIGMKVCKPYFGSDISAQVKAGNKLVFVLKCYPPESKFECEIKANEYY